MSDLVSKLQHNTFEKGEFSEEKTRTLAEIIELIRTFPWDQERPLTSIELTGPSVTIQDEDMNWLKVGLYFNQKFCLYYLDCNNHLYEYHAPNLDDAISMVTAFFNQQLDLQKFEKHFFSLNNKHYFSTRLFYYYIGWQQALAIFAMVLSSLFCLYVCYLAFKLNNSHLYNDSPLFAKLLFPAFFVLFTFRLSYLIYRCQTRRNSNLELSRGKDTFAFTHKGVTHNYRKSNIEKIVIYGSDGGRARNWLGFSEIYFKDSTTLRFSNILIDVLSFRRKFAQELIIRSSKSQYLIF